MNPLDELEMARLAATRAASDVALDEQRERAMDEAGLSRAAWRERAEALAGTVDLGDAVVERVLRAAQEVLLAAAAHGRSAKQAGLLLGIARSTLDRACAALERADAAEPTPAAVWQLLHDAADALARRAMTRGKAAG